MIGNERDRAALRLPDSVAVEFEMTPERKKFHSEVARDVIRLLKSRCKSPLEAYAILRVVLEVMEKVQGIRGRLVVTEDEDKTKH
jgi:hypothetical protein